MMTATRLDATVIREQALGKWREILPRLGVNLPATPKQHGPCPACGGKDRFRFDDQGGRGTWFCNQCDPKAGDGFALVQNVKRCDFPQALQLVADALGYHPVNGHSERRIDAEYNYTDAAGTLLFQVVRFVPKDFRQRRPDGHGDWIWNLTGIEPVLYRLPEVSGAARVLIVEGEKDVETAYRLGLPDGWAATCNPMGAEKWRESYSDALRDKPVVILPDTDEPGRKHGEQVARSLEGTAAQVLALALPDGLKDLSEWAEAGGTAPAFHSLLNNAQPFIFMSPLKNGPLHESNFTPLTAGDFLDMNQEEEAIEWVLDEYLPAGGLALLAGKPKEGKTTLTYELAVRVAKGHPFLNRSTSGGGVLILGLEEHPRDMRLRLRSLGAEALSNLYVYSGQLAPTPNTLERITRFTMEQNIKLILVDTLAAFWSVRDENDAAEVTKAMKPLLRLARETGACVLLIHHARKSEGSYGDEIRGSGALFASVDVALILKRHEVQTQRILRASSRYPETPDELVLELRETGYSALGDPANLNKQARLEKIKTALTETSETPETISHRAGIGLRDTFRLLKALAERGEINQDGKGRKGSPFRYRRNSIHTAPPVLGGTLHESNSAQTGFDSCAPPSPCTNENPPHDLEEVSLYEN